MRVVGNPRTDSTWMDRLGSGQYNSPLPPRDSLGRPVLMELLLYEELKKG